MVKYAIGRNGGYIHIIREDHPLNSPSKAMTLCGWGVLLSWDTFGVRPDLAIRWKTGEVKTIELHPNDQIGLCQICKEIYGKMENQSA